MKLFKKHAGKESTLKVNLEHQITLDQDLLQYKLPIGGFYSKNNNYYL